MIDEISRRKRQMSTAAASIERSHDRRGRYQKVIVCGKGGVGKTTLTAILARLSHRDGRSVLAVDEDPQQNLGFSLGYPQEKSGELLSLAQRFEYIREKVGIAPGEGYGQAYVLNPDVSDVVERFGITLEPGLSLLVMGGVEQASSGCLCPENALLESVIRYIRIREGEMIFLDTQAGLEHFGRAIAGGFGQAIIVAEASYNSLSVAADAARLAGQLHIPVLHLVINKCRDQTDRAKVKKTVDLSLFSTIHYLPFDPLVWDTEPDVSPLLNSRSPFMQEVQMLYKDIMKYSNED
jgi:CO dehydrogenase maturation factor